MTWVRGAASPTPERVWLASAAGGPVENPAGQLKLPKRRKVFGWCLVEFSLPNLHPTAQSSNLPRPVALPIITTTIDYQYQQRICPSRVSSVSQATADHRHPPRRKIDRHPSTRHRHHPSQDPCPPCLAPASVLTSLRLDVLRSLLPSRDSPRAVDSKTPLHAQKQISIASRVRPPIPFSGELQLPTPATAPERVG